MGTQTFIIRLVFFSGVLLLCFYAAKETLIQYELWRGGIVAAEIQTEPFLSLSSMHTRLQRPQPGSWRHEALEFGQTAAEYMGEVERYSPRSLSSIVIQPIGEFSVIEQEMLEQLREFLGIYFCSASTLLAPLEENVVPNNARRYLKDINLEQFHSEAILDQVLRTRMPESAAVLLGVTKKDLYPRDDWGFVFGQASEKGRTAVVSLWQFGNPEASASERRQFLRRLLRTAAHESGHALGISHCIAYRCLMNGSMSMPEADATPLLLGPSCLQKVVWHRSCSVKARFENLQAFYRRVDLGQARAFVSESRHRLKEH